jgi:N-acetylglucosamine kinase-like BadF-type ATPase
VTRVFVGLDVGGTKTALVAESPDGERILDVVLASEDWDAEPVSAGARWIDAALRRSLPEGLEIIALGIGAQGLDTAEVAREFTAELRSLGYRAVCVNDAALLVPAAGCASGLGLIAGTGAIGVGADAHGEPLATGGWGWVLGDEAGAAGIVREAVKSALLSHDDGVPDDGLLGALLEDYGVADAERLARAVNDEPTMANWGPHAPAVFRAADAGSPLARTVVAGAAEHLARLVDQLVRRGAVGSDVVVAGSVIVNQPRLFDAFADLLRKRHPALVVHLLRDAPVLGALALARSEQNPAVNTTKES